MENLVKDGGAYVPRQIVAGNEIGLIADEVILKKGQGELLSGTVLGVITASGLSVPVDSAANDGSETPTKVLTDTIDTDVEYDPVTTGYKTGVFKANMLVFGGTDTLATHDKALRELGIYTK